MQLLPCPKLICAYIKTPRANYHINDKKKKYDILVRNYNIIILIIYTEFHNHIIYRIIYNMIRA